jgi:hypothetical protein
MHRLVVLAIIGLIAHGTGMLRASHHALEHGPAAVASGEGCGGCHHGGCPTPSPQDGPGDQPAPDDGCLTCEVLKGLAGSLVDLLPGPTPSAPPPGRLATPTETTLHAHAVRLALPRGPPARRA